MWFPLHPVLRDDYVCAVAPSAHDEDVDPVHISERSVAYKRAVGDVCNEESVALRPVHVVYKGGVSNIDVLGIHGCDAHIVVHGRDAPDVHGSTEHDVYAVSRAQNRHVLYLHITALLHIYPSWKPLR